MTHAKTALPVRALLYDLARSQRAHLPHLQSVIERLAQLGYNMLVLNLEHRFAFPSRPGIAPPGSLTPMMARHLVDFGAKLGVEVVPQPNLIGHCEGLCATERYAHLSADPWTQAPWGGYEQLNLELAESRELVRDMIADIVAAFPGRYLHIGGDEVRRMDYLFPDDTARQLAAMKEHFGFVLELARSHRREVMIWGDMPLRHPELMAALPRDLIICDWHYGPKGSRETLERYKTEGFRVLAAPSVPTYVAFATLPAEGHANITKMVTDAVDLGLEGFLLTTWEFGQGSAFDLVWPWVALAAALAQGEVSEESDAYLVRFGAARYGVDGQKYARLHALLSIELKAVLSCPRGLGQLRKSLFRGAPAFADIARPRLVPANPHVFVWEPSPFHAWLLVRPLLSGATLTRLRAMRDEAGKLERELAAGARQNVNELYPLLALARAFQVFVERVEILEEARSIYHAASELQRRDRQAFHHHLEHVAHLLERLQTGLDTLREIVRNLDAQTGFDEEEMHWLDIHAQSLAEHVDALRRMRFRGDALLEFGEFLRRPAHVTARVTWR